MRLITCFRLFYMRYKCCIFLNKVKIYRILQVFFRAVDIKVDTFFHAPKRKTTLIFRAVSLDIQN